MKTSRIRQELFSIMSPDEISAVVKSGPSICSYGEVLLSKRKRQHILVVVLNKIREMGRILTILKKIYAEVSCFFELLKPEMSKSLVAATKVISG